MNTFDSIAIRISNAIVVWRTVGWRLPGSCGRLTRHMAKFIISNNVRLEVSRVGKDFIS